MSKIIEFINTKLWQSSLAPQPSDPPQNGPRERLRNAFFLFRERANVLTGEIASDLPAFTVHDITHLDALWEMADKIAGEKISLTPAEAFVLGGAFLIHDAGMGLAAYPEGPKNLKEDLSWGDFLSENYKRRLGRAPTDYERQNPEKEIEFDAIVELLRLRHAKQADKLASISWQSSDGETYHLIEDLELRKGYGTVIGKIAYSHWWDIDKVWEQFGSLPLFPPPAAIGCPSNWTVDRLKLACLLRTADAIHLDARRAPGYLRALRKPSGYADLHWAFQEHIHKPNPVGERLVFVSGESFKIDEADAWWVGYDLLQNADRELRQTDTLLQDKCDYRFAVHSVAGVESPTRLASYIPTDNWVPVDAHIKVSNVAALIMNLGGEQLYGGDHTVPLRELIQNASDAVRARRLLQNKAEDWGDIIVRIGQDIDGHWIEIADNGVGMSTTVLTGPFIDFGCSFWGTEKMREELPCLQGKGFESTGRYGIGFFSVFMWGKRVKVTTRRYGDAIKGTQVLEFKRGIETRPLLRKAQEAECLDDGGTQVRVWLEQSPESLFEESLRYLRKGGSWTLEKLFIWLFPALDASLYIEQAGKKRKVITASDWKIMNGKELCKRILIDWDDSESDEKFSFQIKAADNYRLLEDSSGKVFGRACLILNDNQPGLYPGLITVGGFRSNYLSYVAGLWVGNPTRAARDEAIPVVSVEALQRWASEQALLGQRLYDHPVDLVRFAECVRSCGGDTGDLPIAMYDSGFLSFTDIAEKRDWPEEILLIDLEDILDNYQFHEKFTLDPGVMAVPSIDCMSSYTVRGWQNIFRNQRIVWPPKIAFLQNSGLESSEYFVLRIAVIEALAKAWNSSLEEVLRESSLKSKFREFQRNRRSNQMPAEHRKFGKMKMGESDVEVIADVIRMPKPGKRLSIFATIEH